MIYESKSICALKGSTVNMSCSYTYPQQYKLKDTFWIKRSDVAQVNLNAYPEYKDRVEYIEDRQKKTSILRLHNITENDKIAYCFRFVTETEGQKCQEFILMFLVIHFTPSFLLIISFLGSG